MPPSATEHAITFQELPSEILDIIANQVYDGGLGQFDELLTFSLVSHPFRRSALPFLFKTVSHVVRDRLDQNEHGGFRRLLNHPHLLRFIQMVPVVRPTEIHGFVPSLDQTTTQRLTREHMSSDLQVLKAALPLMTRLRRIRFDCSAAVAYHVLQMLPDNQIYEIVLDNLYSSSNWPTLMEATTELAMLAKHHRLGLGAFGAFPPRGTAVAQATYDAITKAVAIDLHMAWLLKDEQQNHITEAGSTLCPGISETPSWTELRLLIRRAPGTHHSLRDLDLAMIPWINLRRLSIVWEYTMPLNQFIHDVAPKLPNLEALRLRADHQRLYHPACRYEIPTTGLFADTPIVPAFEVDFSHMKRLQELEIDGMCNHIPITSLLGPNLRSLRLHREDALWSVYSAESQRSHTDILTATRISPDLERLELDIGYIENLWHPTAIPGVDVDVEQYAFLNAISKFRRLRYLRLFPPFVPKDSPRWSRSVRHCVPVSDDQAIRVFEYLRKECPSLQVLSIAAIPSLVNIDTMCWEVKRRGDKTILTTEHRERNYQHRQIWVGQRRITGEIKRFTTPQTYLPDSEGWMLTRSDHQ
ncbi:hypothetical protein LTR13_005409 [Exophiala sideris]|uniref:F-box domain-containing protein n=1 Tax=Exophiala sideris TaxID=1016849 RepID=A0ABR0J5I5_9EURO|nr:hypothetical protein LTR13_005409 [Exophiala sideris]KAK5056875.1 hypothetical protein LTR69_007513 [Exophiala sideris]KAK5181282.1 hypothetical protein LTR44_006077 [Eurotiomycetes sp. CCFEE 6388]